MRQVLHHVPDSHINAYVRFRWALTEERPSIKDYDEKAWAELADARTGDIEVSLSLLEAVHARWLALLRSLSGDDFRREVRHPQGGEMSVDYLLAIYAWHGRHHAAHITSLRRRRGW